MEIKDFECFTVEILYGETVDMRGAFATYAQAEQFFDNCKSKINDRFHPKSYGIVVIGWISGEPYVLDEWQFKRAIGIEIPKVICPICGGEIREDDCYDITINKDETIENYIGTCKKCGETVEYDFTYPHKDCKIKIVDHYKD
jgi:hypothetical protein